jgi:flagellar FliJ protein
MQPVAKIVHEWADDAARVFSEGRQEVLVKQQQLEELQAYRDEYARRLERSGEDGLSALQARDFSLFLARLNEAIKQQDKALELARTELETMRRIWQEKHSRANAIDKVLNRQQDREQSSRQRREQRESDEFTQHALRRVSS